MAKTTNTEVEKLENRKKAIELLLNKDAKVIGVNIQAKAEHRLLIEEIRMINKTLRVILTDPS